jgi:hypothetical protein
MHAKENATDNTENQTIISKNTVNMDRAECRCKLTIEHGRCHHGSAMGQCKKNVKEPERRRETINIIIHFDFLYLHPMPLSPEQFPEPYYLGQHRVEHARRRQ